MQTSAIPYQTILRVLFLGSLWGPSFLLIKICLTDLPPITLAAIRFFIAACVMWLVIYLKNIPSVKDITTLKHLFVMSIFSMALPISLICFAEQHISSALAGIINGTVPLGTVLLAHFFIKGEQITLKRLAGVLSGLIGFLILLLPTVLDQNITSDTFGLLAVGLAALCYATGIVYAKKFLANTTGLIVPTIQLSFATLLCSGFALVSEQPWLLAMPSLSSLASLGALSLFGTVGAFIMYYQIITKDGPVVLSMTTYLLPIYAVILGAIFWGEPLNWRVFASIIFILFGLVLINLKSR
jgi:drug/metabolite transporter (DMT)-like permease